MVNGILGKKLGMSRIFAADGRWIPVTLLEVGPCTVVQVKTADKDGYAAAQLGYGEKREKRCTKPYAGHFKRVGVAPARVLREFPVTDSEALNPGDVVKADIFKIGDRIDVAATSKGKGFQGTQKRHGFSGGPKTHGSNFHRAPGSIGQAADPAKVFKGIGMAGRMGGKRVSALNLEVVLVDSEKNLVAVRGAVPGPSGAHVELKHTVKGAK